MSKAFVTGASGLLGRTLIDNLINDGFEVIALIHNTKIKDRKALTIVHGDITKRESFARYLEGVNVIFHLAAIVTDWAPRGLYYDVHVNGTKNLISAAVKYGVRKFMYVSTIDIFAHEKYKIVDENTPFTHSQIPYRRSKLIAYNLTLKEASRGTIQPVILCPSWIYGPGDKIFIAEIIKQLKASQFVFIGNKHNYVPLVYTENLCKLMIDLSKKDIEHSSGVFIVSDINITWEQLIKVICNKIEAQYPRVSLPYSLSYFVGTVMEFYGHLIKRERRPLLTRTAVETVGRSVEADATKISKFIGYKPLVSFENGLEKTINSFISSR